MINHINEIPDKDLFLHVQKRWDNKYPGLKLIVLNDKNGKAYRFTWSVTSEHLEEATGDWEAIAKESLGPRFIDDVFMYKIEKLEAEFKKFAIDHYLRGAI